MSWSSGTNTIKEGDESKSLTLQMLEVKKQGGGTELFVRKNDVKLGTKSVTQNGTYTAVADDKYGFSQFSVNVRGGNGSADSHGKPTGGDIKPGGAGSAVVGTDPETGNDVVVGVDEDGNIVQTPIPSAIEIITPPTKTEYTAGETMDYSGIVVGLKKKDGTTFTDARYMNGHIPMAELIFPVDVAPEPSGSITPADYQTSGTVTVDDWASPINVLEYALSKSAVTFGGIIEAVKNDVRAENCPCIVQARNKIGAFSGWSPLTIYLFRDIQKGDSVHLSSPTAGGSVACVKLETYGASESGGTVINISSRRTVSQYTSVYLGEKIDSSTIRVSGFNASTGGRAEIPVQWESPYDGKQMEDTFEIMVTGTAHTTESSSGTEGSGGGGSF